MQTEKVDVSVKLDAATVIEVIAALAGYQFMMTDAGMGATETGSKMIDDAEVLREKVNAAFQAPRDWVR